MERETPNSTVRTDNKPGNLTGCLQCIIIFHKCKKLNKAKNQRANGPPFWFYFTQFIKFGQNNTVTLKFYENIAYNNIIPSEVNTILKLCFTLLTAKVFTEGTET